MTLNIISIILTVVAVIGTVIGFFASLRFYREGMTLGVENISQTKSLLSDLCAL